MTITQNTKPAALTADTFADLWSQMLRWESAEATAEATPEDAPPYDLYDEPEDVDAAYEAEWDQDPYGILNFRFTRY